MQCGIVDYLEGKATIKLKKEKSGQCQLIPLKWFISVDKVGGKVHVGRSESAARKEWKTSASVTKPSVTYAGYSLKRVCPLFGNHDEQKSLINRIKKGQCTKRTIYVLCGIFLSSTALAASKGSGQVRATKTSAAIQEEAIQIVVELGMSKVEQLDDPLITYGAYALGTNFLLGGAMDYWNKTTLARLLTLPFR